MRIAEREYKTLKTMSENQDIDARALNNKDKKYDFYVLYDDKDRVWVCYS